MAVGHGREVEAAGCEQVHFAKSTAGTCYTVEVAGNKAKIPDELLQAAGRVYAWAYITDETYGGRTRIEALWDVKRRAKPAEYVYEPSDQRTIKDAETARDEAKAAQKAAEAARDRAIAAEVKGARATTLASGSEATAAMEGNILVVGVPKGDALRYSDLTDEQVAELKKPATDAAAEIGKTNEEYKAMLTEQAKAFGDAQQARAESYTDAERARDKAYTKAETDRNAAYNEAEGKRQAAERVRGENEGGRKSAETERDTAEKARVEAEAKREQGWTDLKAEAEKSVSDAVERADAASKAATKAVADVKATEAKLYPVAENTLKGTTKGTFVHFDDAFPAPLCGLTVYGRSTHDGTPSPDNHVSIVSAGDGGSVAVKVTGKNRLSSNLKYQDIVECYVEKNTPITLVFKEGTVSQGGNIRFFDENDNEYWFGIDANKTEHHVTFPADLVKFQYLLTPGTNSENLCMTWNASSPDYEPYREQLLTLPTPNGLPGIPVTFGGNYTDSQGQQWVCDEVDLERGVKVQRVNQLKLDALQWRYELTPTNKNDTFISVTHASQYGTTQGFSLCQYAVFDGAAYDIEMKEACRCYVWVQSVTLQFKAGSGVDSVDAFSEWLKARPDASIFYCLATPIETPLTSAEIAAYKALTTYGPDTVVQAGDGAGVKLKYQRDVNIVVANLESAIASIS